MNSTVGEQNNLQVMQTTKMEIHLFCLTWIFLCVTSEELNNYFIIHPSKDPQIRYIFLN